MERLVDGMYYQAVARDDARFRDAWTKVLRARRGTANWTTGTAGEMSYFRRPWRFPHASAMMKHALSLPCS